MGGDIGATSIDEVFDDGDTNHARPEVGDTGATANDEESLLSSSPPDGKQRVRPAAPLAEAAEDEISVQCPFEVSQGSSCGSSSPLDSPTSVKTFARPRSSAAIVAEQ